MKTYLANVNLKIMKIMFSEKFFHDFKSPLMKFFFFVYCLSGGFCFNDRVNTTFRKFWLGYNICSLFVVFVCCGFYFANLVTYDIKNMAIPIFSMCEISGVESGYMITYITREELLKFITFINQQYSTEKKAIDVQNLAIALTTSLCILVLTGSMLFDPRVYIAEYLKIPYKGYTIFYYPIYFPFENTPAMDPIIHLFQWFTLLPCFAALISMPVFCFICVAEMYNNYWRLKEFMEDFLQSALRSIEETYDLESSKKVTKNPYYGKENKALETNRKKLVQKFLSHLTISIARFQLLHR